jgi:hypothetical protein
MNWKVSKEFRFSDNLINVKFAPIIELDADTSIVGHQNFNKEQWEKLWILAGRPFPVIQKSNMIGDVISSFSVTTEMLEEAGIAFLVGKGNTKNWATSTSIEDKNPNFTLMTVSEMLNAFGLS